MSTKLEKICSRLSSEKGSSLWVVQDGGFWIAGYTSDFMVAAAAANALNIHFKCLGAFKVCEA